MLHEVTSGLGHAARLGRNTFELDGDRSLGVVIDRDRVKRALTNVLDNALRYSPPGAPIHVGWARVDESTVRVAVRDNGPGIDPALFPHVFEPHDRETAPRTAARHSHRRRRGGRGRLTLRRPPA